MKKLYFGHPINVYDTELETKLCEEISKIFHHLGWDIENPNKQKHQDGYQLWLKTKGNGMKYYFEEVLPACHGGIFLPFRDGAWGKGVFGEAEFLFSLGHPIWRITHDFTITKLDDLSKVRVLSVEETRLRIRNTNGTTAPY